MKPYKIAPGLIMLAIKIIRRLWMYFQLALFKSHGRNIRVGHSGQFSYETIELASDVYIGPGAIFMSGIRTIKIGNKVMFGPNVTIMGGDHRTDVVGAYMFDVREKLPENDMDVIIEDDVWVGARATILKGVRIGRGSIIGAGSVVTKSIPAYSVAMGSPAKVVRSRFTPEQIIEHEASLGILDRKARI